MYIHTFYIYIETLNEMNLFFHKSHAPTCKCKIRNVGRNIYKNTVKNYTCVKKCNLDLID